MTVTRTETSEGFEGVRETQAPRGAYLFVHMTVTDTGTTPGAFPFMDLALMDSAGRTFSIDWEATLTWLVQNTDLDRAIIVR